MIRNICHYAKVMNL